MAISDDENRFFIGAPGKNSGQAYQFMPSGGSWVEESIFTRPAGTIYGDFGQSIAIDGAGLALTIGAWLNGSGGIHYYERTGNNWNLKQTLISADNRQEHLGYDLAMSNNGDVIVGGARFANSGAIIDAVGSVYTFVPGYQVFLPGIIK